MAEEPNYLPISDAMGRDIDKGLAAGRDVADFLPDSVAQEMYDMSHPAPVHAENLVPISAAQAAEMRRIDPASGSLPKFPATRRVIPAPYKRDRVVGGDHGKAWTLVTADKVRKGDIILPDVGMVVSVQERVVYENLDLFAPGESGPQHLGNWKPDDKVATRREYVVTGAGGNVVTYPSHAEVQVFRSRTS